MYFMFCTLKKSAYNSKIQIKLIKKKVILTQKLQSPSKKIIYRDFTYFSILFRDFSEYCKFLGIYREVGTCLYLARLQLLHIELIFS